MQQRGRRGWRGSGCWLLLVLAAAACALPAVRAQGPAQVASPAPRKLAAIALSIKSRAIQDGRCYLMNGGAVESFFIGEDTPVGSVVGTLSVNGDPSDDGDITLRIQEKAAALGIAPGTKNVTLLRALDREERLGPSNVYVNVRCDRRRTTDPSFIIPVSVRVWDVNDNAPAWEGAPYAVRLSELTAVGSRVTPAARAADADQPGPHATVHYAVLPGPHSEYFGFQNELDGMLVLKKPLDYETLSKFTIGLRAADEGSPPRYNDTTLSVEVLDADDQNPKFSHEHYTAVVPDGAAEGTELEISPGPIVAVDQDTGLNAPLFYSVGGGAGGAVSIERDSGRVLLASAGALPATVVIKATQYDNPDRYALATLGVSRRAPPSPSPTPAETRPVRFTQRAYSVAVPEDTAPGTALLTLHTEGGAQGAALQFYVSERSFLQQFAISAAGGLLLRAPLDHEGQERYAYRVMVTDGRTNDTAELNITVLNVNDWEPRFKYPQYEFRVDEELAARGGGRGELVPVGKLDVFDGDKGDYVTLSLRGPDASLFYVNALGEVFLRPEALQTLNSSAVTVVATASDSGVPPRQSSVPVTVHVDGRLLAGGGARRAGGGALLALFAAALAALALLVLGLLGYIYRNKRLKAHSKPSPSLGPPEKAPRPPPSPRALPPAGSLQSLSAGASTILANSSSSLDLRDTLPHAHNAPANRQSQRFPAKSRIAPLPPSTPQRSPGHTLTSVGGAGGAGGTVGPGGGLALMSDHLAGGGGRSGVAWPSATIPARVKKLSWDDAETDKGGGESVTQPPEAASPRQDHMNLTVYF